MSNIFLDVYNAVISMIPEFYIKNGELEPNTFVDREFEVNGIKFDITYEHMNDFNFFCIGYEGNEPGNFMSLSHHIKVHRSIGGFTDDEGKVLEVLNSCNDGTRMYFCGKNKILYNSEVMNVDEITKDEVFNLSTYMDNNAFNAFTFLYNNDIPFNYVYINLNHSIKQ